MSSRKRKKKQQQTENTASALTNQETEVSPASASGESSPEQNEPKTAEPVKSENNLPEAEKSPDSKPQEAALKPDEPVKVVRAKAASDRVQTPLRRKDPVRTVTPADIKKPQVSFMNSIANVEAESRAQRDAHVAATSQAYDHAVLVTDDENGEYRPKIRRMHDSTRAKELRRRQPGSDAQPYQKVTPVSSMQTLPASKLRKRREKPDSPEVMERIPDNLKQHPREAARPIRYIGQAEHTQLNLSASNSEARRHINIDVRYQDERRERTDLPMEAKQQTENREAIRNDLNELNLNLSLRIFILGFLAICSGLITLFDWLPSFPMPAFLSSKEAPIAYLTIQLLLGLASLPFVGSLLKNGYTKLLRLRADCDSLAAMSMMTAEIAAFLILPSPGMLRTGVVSVYISIGLFSLVVNAIGKKMIAARALHNFERLTDGNPKYAIHYVEDEKRAENLTRGTTGDFPILAAMQPVDNPEDFLKYTFSTDVADKFCRTAVPLITLLAGLFAVGIALLRRDHVDSAVCYGTSIFALCFSACACTAITLISNLPMLSGTRDYIRNSGMLLGYQSVDDFFDVNTVMVDATALFPQGSTKLESIQVVGEAHTEEALRYAASLTNHAGSILKDIFANAILTEETLLLPVENYVYDESKGISGWIENKRVLLGTRDMMIEHSIEGIPATAKVRSMVKDGEDALYLSIAGSVAALFIVRLEANKSIRHWLKELERENLFLLVRSTDAMLSQRRISKLFGMREEHVKIIPARYEADFIEETRPLQTAKPSMLCAGRLAGFIQTIIGAKRIRSIANLGLILQAVTACLGFLFVLIFIILGAYSEVSGGILLIYHLICTIVTVLTIRMKDT